MIRLIVSKASLGLPIRFYCKKIKKSSFFQKWYSESCQSFFRFYQFWELQWCSSWLRNFFRSSQCIKYAFKTSPRNHSFATKWFRVSQVIVSFLCGCTKSKSVIFTCLRQSITISKLAHICGILLHFLTSGASKIFRPKGELF